MPSYPLNPSIISYFDSAKYDGTQIQISGSSALPESNGDKPTSFIYDPSNAPLKNTQQLNIDWSRFENHTFFSSAEAKINLTVDQIINKFPFDGTKSEVEAFFERLTGFDKWVFDNLPKYKGHARFDGNDWIETKDQTGLLQPSLSRDNTGSSVINPKGVPITFDFLFYPEGTNQSTYYSIFQKIKDANNYMCLYYYNSKTYLSIRKGTQIDTISFDVTPNKWNHITVTWDQKNTETAFKVYVNEKRVIFTNTPPQTTIQEDLDIDSANIEVGGSGIQKTINNNNNETITLNRLVGRLDDFRVFHEERTESQIKQYSKRSLFATKELKLYYKFNEPEESGTSNNLILDSSGNSLHARSYGDLKKINNVGLEEPIGNPLPLERDELSVVLFPTYEPLKAFLDLLLEEAILYDKENPNLITKLVPEHYLLQGSVFDGTDDLLDADRSAKYEKPDLNQPGQFKLNSTQIIISFLYIWARFFDEMKIYIDSFSTLKTFNYEAEGSSPDNFLLEYVRSMGFFMSPLFTGTTLKQYVDGEGVVDGVSLEQFPLKKIESEITRRIIKSLPSVIRSKGTQHSIKSFLRAVGINPDASLRIREYGGANSKKLSQLREKRSDEITFFEIGDEGLFSTLLVKNWLSENDKSPKVFSADEDRSLLTVSSWTVDFNVSFLENFNVDQSLVRISGGVGAQGACILNFIFNPNEKEAVLLINPYLNTIKTFSLKISNLDLFDKNIWKISFGCKRINLNFSEYFLRILKVEDDQNVLIREEKINVSDNEMIDQTNFLRKDMSSRLEIGKRQERYFISNRNLGDQITHLDNCNLFGVKFWTRALDLEETIEHAKNPRSVGQNNVKEYNDFIKKSEGNTSKTPFERLRFNFFGKQPEKNPGDSGTLHLLDLSGNGHTASVTGLYPGTNYWRTMPVHYTHLSPYFDESSSSDKVRIRGLLDPDPFKDPPWTSKAPYHEIPEWESPRDDNRFSVEFSLVDALNKDIINIFSSLDEIENAIGAPELQFSPDYPDLERLRNIYFDKLKGKMNFQLFFEFFKWFDQSLSRFIGQLVPRKTSFKGTNFVIESHMLERSKFEQESSGMYANAGINFGIYRGSIS